MNELEIGMILAALAIFVRKKGKRPFWNLIVWAMLLFFSIAMATECITADEYGYMQAFIDIKNIENYIDPMKAVYEYRTSQMVFGTFFQLIPQNLKSMASGVVLLRIYKVVHYFFFLGIVFLTSWIWSHRILKEDTNSRRFWLADQVVLYCLLALPVSCLLLKVCNYDATNVYFAILGFSFIIAGEKNNNLKYAFMGTIAAVFGCMDKWTGLLYWCCCVMLFIYIGIRSVKRWRTRLLYAVKYSIEATAVAVGISWLNLLYLGLLKHGFYVRINIGNILFPFTQTLRALTSKNMGVDYTDGTAYCDGALKYILAVMAMMVICALFVCLYNDLDARFQLKASGILGYLNAFLLSLNIIGGGLGAYFIPQYIAPFKEIGQGFYASSDSFDNWVYHYGAVNAIQHFVCKMLYTYATILCSYPSAVSALLILGTCVIIKKNKDFAAEGFMHIILFISLIQPILYSIAGLPIGAKYYGVTIILQAVICSYYLYMGMKDVKVQKYENAIVCTAVFLCIAEMAQFVPNMIIFSPMWAVHSESYKTSVRKGTWYAGEAMTWGEDMAIAGRVIQKLAEESGVKDDSQISIYGNYGTVWLNNPGFCIGGIDKGSGSSNYKWDDTEYIVLSKFKLFRYDIPDFIYEVQPAAVIAYNGEISSWIYRGSQLADYREYFD